MIGLRLDGACVSSSGVSFILSVRHAKVARVHSCSPSQPARVPPLQQSTMKLIHERLNLSVSFVSLPFSLSLNKGSRYTNEDDSYIFVPAEPANASPLVVHRNSGDIALECRSLNSQLTAYKYLLREQHPILPYPLQQSATRRLSMASSV